MRKYYIVATNKALEFNKPLVKHCAFFRTLQQARAFSERLKTKYRPSDIDILEVLAEEMHLITILDKNNAEIIIGGCDKREAAEELKEELLLYFPNRSFSVRPFKTSDFTEKQGAFYA